MFQKQMKKIIIIDYQLGNLFSVKNACKLVGGYAKISSDPCEVETADALILPGVGAFKTAMGNLKSLRLLDPVLKHVFAGKPIFGICLGLQLLFEGSEEFGSTAGLGVLRGNVKRLPGHNSPVPQIGWNQIFSHRKAAVRWNTTPLMAIPEGAWMYFVHSYYVDNDDPEDSLCTTEYSGFKYTSGVIKNNIFGVQFHPEKSSEIGLDIYRAWFKMLG